MNTDLRRQAKQQIQLTFAKQFSANEIQAMNFWLIDELIKFPEIDWSKILQEWKELLYNKQTPIQYLFNRAFFGSLELFVNANTLIPRPETEELCELILNHPENTLSSSHQLLDIGTGSGCIPIWLKHNRPNWQISAIDISVEALAVAERNAHTYKTNIHFQTANILELANLPDNYSIVVSNPPYIPKKDGERLNKNVIDFEPHLALFVENNDPLIFYKKIAILFKEKKNLKQIWVEIDSQSAEENLKLFNKIGVAQIIHDYSGNPRFVFCQCNN